MNSISTEMQNQRGEDAAREHFQRVRGCPPNLEDLRIDGGVSWRDREAPSLCGCLQQCGNHPKRGIASPTQLNIHNAGKKSKSSIKPAASIFRENNSVLSQEKGKQSKVKYKPTFEELLRRQMAELKANQEREAVLLQEQLNKLEKTIQEAKRQEAEVL